MEKSPDEQEQGRGKKKGLAWDSLNNRGHPRVNAFSDVSTATRSKQMHTAGRPKRILFRTAKGNTCF